MKYSLRFKINGAILATFMLVMAVLVATLIPFQNKKTEQALAKTGQMLNILALRENDFFANELFENRMTAIALRLEKIMLISGIVGIEIFDAEKVLISSTGRCATLEPLSGLERDEAAPGYDTKTLEEDGDSVMLFTQKISSVGELFGYLRICYLVNDIRDDQKQSLFILLSMLVAVLFLMIFLLNFLLSIFILQPISKLKEITQSIKSKGPGQVVEIASLDEVGELSEAFNNMSESLKESNLQIERQSEKLWNTKNYLDNIINSMPSVLIGVDAEEKVVHWNKTAEQVTGVLAGNAHGKKLTQVFPRIALELGDIRERIRRKEISQEQKIPRLTDDGVYYEDVTIYPLGSSGIDGAVIRVDDVTDIVRLEEVMVQSEKMLSVGGLAAGMAHEINNPLAGMMQTAEVMADRLTNMDMVANKKVAEEIGIRIADIKTFMEKRGILRMVAAITESGNRVADIVHNMLSFARKTDVTKESHDLVELLEKTVELAATDYDLKMDYDFKLIEIKKEFAADLPLVPCESAKIQQVLLNILRNGAQAMQHTGTKNPLFILRARFEEQTQTVCLEIEDNGPGMDEQTRKRVFEPFFTTKSVGVGTGLGLSVSYFIITENHGGEMAVESHLGGGAKFITRLPLHERTLRGHVQ